MKKETITRPQNQAPPAAADKQAPTRRDFVKTTAAAGAGLLIVPSAIAFGSAVNSSLGLGVIGCGGRGHNHGGGVLQKTNARITAPAPVFLDPRLLDSAHLRQKTQEKRPTKKFYYKTL